MNLEINQLNTAYLLIAKNEIAYQNNMINYLNQIESYNTMGLKEIVDSGLKMYTQISDTVRLGKGLMYFADGERYRLLQDEQTFKYFKRRCVQEFKKLSDPEIIDQFKDIAGSYLPKKYK